MILEGENLQGLMTGKMGLARKGEESRVSARFWLGNQQTTPPSPMRQVFQGKRGR